MADKKELGYPEWDSSNWKERMAKQTLRFVRGEGHTCVDIRADGSGLVFYCMLCSALCYGEPNLMSHLEGRKHTESFAAAQAVLLKENPFPFNDGVHFVFYSTKHVKEFLDLKPFLDSKPKTTAFLDAISDDSDEENLENNSEGNRDDNGDTSHQRDEENLEKNSEGNGNDSVLVIPGVLCGKEITNLEVRRIGVGKIGARFYEKDGVKKQIRRIWCEWLGTEQSDGDRSDVIREHDFAIVTFSYFYDLGRTGYLEQFLLSPSVRLELEEQGGAGSKKRKRSSDPEDVVGSSNNSKSTEYDEESLHSRILSNKELREQLRKRERLAAERSCTLCKRLLLPGKDVATLLNMKTGKLACTSRNNTGRFHVHHVSCLIHWILLCELEIFGKKPVASPPPVKRKYKRKVKAKKPVDFRKEREEMAARKLHYCPDCQGSGIDVAGEDVEDIPISLSQIHEYKLKDHAGHKAWKEHPEELQHCSTGFYFPPQTEDVFQESVSSLKLLPFYRAREEK